VDCFDLARLERRLAAGRWLARKLTQLESCRSSNESAKELLEAGTPLHSALFLAWEQTGGRGRAARDWWSGPPGGNLAVTLCHREERVRPELFGLIGAVAVATVLGGILRSSARLSLKWPNDILLDGAKIAGFLCEQPAAGDGVLLLGLGCNLAAAPDQEVSSYPTTCLADHLPPGQDIPRVEDFLAMWLWEFEHGLRHFVLASPEDFEASFLSLLQHWAPQGVVDPRDGRSGPLLEFSVSRGLRWGSEPDAEFRPLGWIPTLEPLKP
jgi:BirA family biotin operon repressor/biotin-[acetyl-CoA-carboxylase] ligase